MKLVEWFRNLNEKYSIEGGCQKAKVTARKLGFQMVCPEDK